MKWLSFVLAVIFVGRGRETFTLIGHVSEYPKPQCIILEFPGTLRIAYWSISGNYGQNFIGVDVVDTNN